MAYCRFGCESDVYLFYNVGEYYDCCGCSLKKFGSTEMHSITEVIKHLKEHIKKGDIVPEHAFKQLESEAAKEIIEFIKTTGVET